MRRVAITGSSGYIGGQLVRRLSSDPAVEAIIGIDARPPENQPSKLRFYLRDVAKPWNDLLTEEGVDAAIHLAFVVRPSRNDRDTRLVNVEGTRNFLNACHRAKVGQVIYLGSMAAYGAHPDNPAPLLEHHPLRPNERFQYSRDKAATDHLVQEYAVSNRDVSVTILRGAVVLGPGGAQAVGAKVFQPVMVRLAGHDPPVQYIHEEDLIEMLVKFLEHPVAGIFNAAADGLLQYTDVARLARRPMMAVPKSLLSGLMNVTWALRLQSQSTSAGLDFIAYPWVGGNAKLKEETGFAYRYTTQETVESYLRSRSK